MDDLGKVLALLGMVAFFGVFGVGFVFGAGLLALKLLEGGVGLWAVVVGWIFILALLVAGGGFLYGAWVFSRLAITGKEN